MLVKECSSEEEKSVGMEMQRKRILHGYLCSGHKDSCLKDSDPSTLSERSASREKRLKNEKQLGEEWSISSRPKGIEEKRTKCTQDNFFFTPDIM